MAHKLQFKTIINAPVKKVWNTMLNDETYRIWTEAFSKGSYYEGSWEEGARIKFLGTSEKGTFDGMISRIAENRPYEFLSIEHLGEIHDGVEDTTSDRVKQWSGAHENYTFKEVDGKTELTIDMDNLTDEFKEMFEKMWPDALERLKKLAEGK